MEKEERSRHFLWIPGDREIRTEFAQKFSVQGARFLFLAPPITQNSHRSSRCDLTVPIRSVHLFAKHTGPRGPKRYEPLSSVGRLADSEPCIVYRVILYWDGFQMQAGRQVSGSGIYLVCLNILRHLRDDPRAIRTISLTPPGMKCRDVLQTIVDDVVLGMNKGFTFYEANGVRRRIFLDKGAFLGDTPALNEPLDVLGHTGASCCHLCRFTSGSSTDFGSRFATCGSHGSSTPWRRTY